MYKIIACDLDETLLCSDNTVSRKNKEYIKKASELGVKFAIATGRGYTSIQNDLKALDLYDKENEYSITYNGSLIIENKDNRFVYYQGIDFDTARFIYEFGQKYDVCIHAYTKDECYILNMTQAEIDYLGTKMSYVRVDDKTLDFLKGQDIIKCIYVNTDRSYLQEIEKDIAPFLKDIDITYSSNRYIEFCHQGINKGTGLKYLAETLDIDIRDTIAIGDNFNDLSMIQAAGLGVGVSNTPKDMQHLCDYVTENDNNHDAIAEVIEKFILNKNDTE